MVAETAAARGATPGTARDTLSVRAERLAFGSLDGLIVAFAWFTLLAQAWDLADLPVQPLLPVWLVTLVIPYVVARRWRGRTLTGEPAAPGWLDRLPHAGPGADRLWAAGVLLVGLPATLLLALHTKSLWQVGWALGLVAVLAGTVLLLIGRAAAAAVPAASPSRMASAREHASGLWLALGVGVVFGIGSLVTVSPNGDDVYYVNRAAWIAEHQRIPDHDTMYSDNVLTALYRPALGTWETFVGALAGVLHVSGPFTDYVLLSPLLLALVPLMLWRAVRALDLGRPLLGFVLALAFLVFSGGGPQWFGEMVLTRPWQTKEIYAAGLIGLTYAYVVRLVRTRRLTDAALLVAVVVASVGLTSSAAGLTPALLVALGIAVYLTCGARLLVPILVAGSHPLACLVAYRFSGSSSSFSVATRPYYHLPFPLWQFYMGTGVVGVVVAGGLVLAMFGPRGAAPADRLASLGLAAGSCVVFVGLFPKVLDVVGPFLGGAPTAWRVVWLAPLPLFVAAAVPGVEHLLRRTGAPVATPVVAVATALAVLAMALLGVSVDESTGTRVAVPPRVDVRKAATRAAHHLADVAPPGSTVAGPKLVSQAVGILEVGHVLALNPRHYYGRVMQSGGLALEMDTRDSLTQWLSGKPSRYSDAQAVHLLRVWPVAAVCLSASKAATGHRAAALLAGGYRAAGSDPACRYFASPR